MLLTSSWWDNIITFKNKRKHVELSSPCSSTYVEEHAFYAKRKTPRSSDKIVRTIDTHVEQRLTESNKTLLRERIRKKLNRKNTRREFQNQEEHIDDNSAKARIIHEHGESELGNKKRENMKKEKKKWISLREQRRRRLKLELQIKRERYRRHKLDTYQKVEQLRVETGQSKKPKKPKSIDSFEQFEKRRKELLQFETGNSSLKPHRISETEWRRKHRRLIEHGEKYEHTQATSPREFSLQKAKLREQRAKYGKIESWVHPSDRRSYNQKIANLISLDKANDIDNIPIIDDSINPTKPINISLRKPRQKRYKNNNPENLYLYRAGLL